MTCSHCSKEYDSSVLTCPECGRTLTYGADTDETVQTTVPSPAPAPFPHFDLSSTVSVSGSASIRSRLRPRTVWEIVGEAFTLYYQNWKVFLPVALILYAPIFVCQFFFQGSMQHMPAGAVNPVAVFGQMGPLFVFMLVLAVLSLVISFVLTRGVSNCYVNKPISVSEMLKLNNRFWGFLGATLLTGLIELGAAGLLVALACGALLPSVIHGHGSGQILAVLLLVLAYVVLVFFVIFPLSVLFMVVAPTAVVEGRGAVESVRRGVGLMRGFFWKGAGVLLLSGLIVWAVQSIFAMVGMIFVVVSVAASGHAGPGMSDSVLAAQAFLSWLGSSLAIPVMMLMIVLFYYDLRIRKEAFDLQMLSEQLGYGVENAA